MLKDSFGREINYLRLAITDRCNLRCQYCMPAEGIQYEVKDNLLTYEEMIKIVESLVELGIEKIRLTGGEPFVRKDFIYFLKSLNKIEGLKEINITTNGTLIYKFLESLKKIDKINSINLSIDSLDKENFFKITRRDAFERVWKTLNELIEADFDTKLNVVVLPNQNTNEIKDFVALTQKKKISVRFIEEMPFNGSGKRDVSEIWNMDRILYEIGEHYPKFSKIESSKNSTSVNYKLPAAMGTFGVIPAYTRTICGGCNRIRITATGDLKLCLFDDGTFNFRKLIRNGISSTKLKEVFVKLINKKPKNGFEAEKNRTRYKKVSESMSTIGG